MKTLNLFDNKITLVYNKDVKNKINIDKDEIYV